MDQHLILTAETLSLSDELHAGAAVEGLFTLKYLPRGTYLNLTASEYRVLKVFGSGAKVPNVLKEIILDRRCPPLPEFYELVLKARRAGILRSEPETSAPPPPILWWPRFKPGFPILLSVCANLATLFLIFEVAIVPQWRLQVLVAGWGIFCAAVSAGYILAASVIAGANAEVYRPRLVWQSLTPHFAVDLSDARMGDQPTQLGVWLARLLPPAIAAATLLLFYPGWSLLPVAGWLWMMRPFSSGSAARIREIALKGLKPDSQRDFIFEPNCTLLARWRSAWRILNGRLLTAALSHAVVWLAAVVVWALKWSGLPRSILRQILEADLSLEFWLVFAAWLLLATSAWLLIGAGASIEKPWGRYRRRLKTFWNRNRRYREKKLELETIIGLLGRSPVFRHLKPETRARLAERMAFRTARTGTVLCGFDDEPPEVGLIVTGRVKLYRRLKSGRREPLGIIEEGEIFGAHRMLDTERYHQLVKAKSPLRYLAVPPYDFWEIVIGELGLSSVEAFAIRQPFLRRLRFCEDWHPQAVMRFAQLSTVVNCNEGDYLIGERQDTLNLFIVYEGHMIVRQRNRARARLRRGSFFGEIGLLQNSAANSDVVANAQSRCLAIDKEQFLRFMTHNFSVGLQVERISSQRLGHPIFPLRGRSFDVR